MNLQAIIITNCIGAVMLLSLLISSQLTRQRKQLCDKLFGLMVVISGLSCFIETVSFCVDKRHFPGAIVLNVFSNSWLFVTNVAVSCAWCVYVDLRLYNDPARIRKYYRLVCLPSTLTGVITVINLKWPILFTVSRDNVYTRLPLTYMIFALTFLYMGFSVFVLMRYNKRYGKVRFFPIWMYLVPIIAGGTLQIIWYGISLIQVSIAMGMVSIHMGLQNELMYIDPLTKCFNRNYLNHLIKEITHKKNTIGGLMIDLDYFKKINDDFGHTSGDLALVEVADILRNSVPLRASVIRFAGDEFIVVFRIISEDDVRNVAESIRAGVEQFNALELRPYELSLSIGGSILKIDGTVDQFLNEMDENMYKEKRTKHSREASRIAS